MSEDGESSSVSSHEHANKTVLDGITSALVTKWNNAFSHISDAVKHITSDERNLWNTVSNKAERTHTHDQYLTEHQDISGKQDVISDLNDIRTNAALGATALQEVPSEYVTDSELSAKGYSTTSYVDNKVAALISGAPETLDTLDELAAALKDNKDIVTVLENSIASKQDKINDLDNIRANAALGATALQSVPSEYVTETELNNKGYLTEHQDISGKQDKINDLDTIRANASKGATALQSIPSEYITESELNAKGYLTNIPSEYVTDSELTNKGFATKAELTGYTTDAEYNALVATVNGKADSSVLGNYSTTGHAHNDLYYSKSEVDSKLNGKQNTISDLDNIRSGAAKGNTALQSVPSDYAKITDVEEMIANAITLTLNTEI